MSGHKFNFCFLLKLKIITVNWCQQNKKLERKREKCLLKRSINKIGEKENLKGFL